MSSTFYSFARNSASPGFALVLLFLANMFLPAATGFVESRHSDRSGDLINGDRVHTALEVAIRDAKTLLISSGVPESNLCRDETLPVTATNRKDGIEEYDALWALPFCDYSHSSVETQDARRYSGIGYGSIDAGRNSRSLEEDETNDDEENPWFFVVMGSCALICVMTAALAAGLTMGMLSLDTLMLLVKIRAARSQKEKEQAQALLPIVKQHHYLLVTLLLLNSMANEALPLFLDRLVSPIAAVLLSVTFVLIFGEILPSAIFTGPKKLEPASKMVPLVKVVMILVWPIAYPIAKVLDKVLHEDEGEDGNFDRGEISALVRIQYEERISNKRQQKLDRMSLVNQVTSDAEASAFEASKRRSRTDMMARAKSLRASIHVDEVMMVEGALQMKTKTAFEYCTPVHGMFAVPDSLMLNEGSIVDIHSSGYSRIPVYEENPLKPRDQSAIKGILITKNLIVVNMNEDRPLSTMPLLTPPCVSPKMNLVDLLNIFQTGKHGHFALVCARARVGTEALERGNAVPAAAGFIGIITLEDVLEQLLQEEIYDEHDQNTDKQRERIAIWVGRKWKNIKRRRELNSLGKAASMGDVVEQVRATTTNESTSLLGTNQNINEGHIDNRNSSLLGAIFQSVGLQ